MDRRQFLHASLAALAPLAAAGCRSNQFARVKKPGEGDMVGSHQAGAETFKPLVDEAVSCLLAHHSGQPAVQQVSGSSEPIAPGVMRICFVGVENKTAEEIGDFKDQLYQVIDSRILESHVFQPISQRFVEAGLMEARLRPDQLMIPENRRIFARIMEQQGQSFDFLLYATLTSGTTRVNKDYQRDYLLTMEMVNLQTGDYDKQSATITKGYYHSRVSRWWSAAKS
ncbi:MAG TPA: penicillin-binding protein activator LpoB [Pirellulales bacterium]|jgi:hypothetical protein|nr:penicillin-binding protein activator LpoB [Pirellulales bacterium]